MFVNTVRRIPLGLYRFLLRKGQVETCGKTRLLPQRIAKLNCMTILVGMVGSNGVLIAADQLMVQDDQLCEKTFHEHEGISKIQVSEKHSIAYARVGDYVTKAVANRFLSSLEAKTFDHSDIGRQLEEIAHTVLVTETAECPTLEMYDRSLLIAFYGQQAPCSQLWRLG